MYQQPRMGSTAEACDPQNVERLPHGLYDSRDWDDHAVDDDEIYLAAVEGFLPREAGVAQQSIAQILRFRNSTDIGIRNDSRLDQQNAQGNLPAGGVVEFARANPPLNHRPISGASNRTRTAGCESQNVTEHGFSPVNQEWGA